MERKGGGTGRDSPCCAHSVRMGGATLVTPESAVRPALPWSDTQGSLFRGDQAGLASSWEATGFCASGLP